MSSNFPVDLEARNSHLHLLAGNPKLWKTKVDEFQIFSCHSHWMSRQVPSAKPAKVTWNREATKNKKLFQHQLQLVTLYSLYMCIYIDTVNNGHVVLFVYHVHFEYPAGCWVHGPWASQTQPPFFSKSQFSNFKSPKSDGIMRKHETWCNQINSWGYVFSLNGSYWFAMVDNTIYYMMIYDVEPPRCHQTSLA